MLTLNDGRSELWQWDTGRKLTVDADCSQVHFSNKVFGRSIDVDVIDGVANIPDILLQIDKELTAWAFVGTTENGYTKISKVFKVNKRNKPADYVFTPPEQTTLAEIMERLDDLEAIQDPDAIKNAVEDYLEQNPVEVPVESVNGKTGKVNLTATDVGAISQDDLQEATNEALEQAKESGEFDGKDGATFTPSLDDEGNLSWSNDKGLQNPEPKNIRGPQGPEGPAGEVSDDKIAEAVKEYLDENPTGGGLSATAANLLIEILRKAQYFEDQEEKITNLQAELLGVRTYHVYYYLEEVTSSNNAVTITHGKPYTATLTAPVGTLTSVKILMGDEDITANVYTDGVITITEVTDDVYIYASAETTDFNAWGDGYFKDNGTILDDGVSIYYKEFIPVTEGLPVYWYRKTNQEWSNIDIHAAAYSESSEDSFVGRTSSKVNSVGLALASCKNVRKISGPSAGAQYMRFSMGKDTKPYIDEIVWTQDADSIELPFNSTWIEGYQASGSGGYNPIEGSATTLSFSVNEGEVWRLSTSGDTALGWIGIATFSDINTFRERTALTVNESSYEFTVPADVKYIFFSGSILGTILDTLTLEKIS